MITRSLRSVTSLMPPFRFLFSLNDSSWVVVSCDLPVVGVVGTALTCHGFTTSFTMYISGLTLLFHSPAGLFSSFYLNSILLKQAEWLCPQALTGWGSGLGLSILILSHLDKVNECKNSTLERSAVLTNVIYLFNISCKCKKETLKKKRSQKRLIHREDHKVKADVSCSGLHFILSCV